MWVGLGERGIPRSIGPLPTPIPLDTHNSTNTAAQPHQHTCLGGKHPINPPKSTGTQSGTGTGTIAGMAALNVQFTDEEMEQIREEAAKEGTSVKKLAHDAVISDLHRRRVIAAAMRTARISAGLNKRLAQ